MIFGNYFLQDMIVQKGKKLQQNRSSKITTTAESW
jgi:hypothetical protein